MPVIGTPVGFDNLPPGLLDAGILSPVVSQKYGIPMPTKRRAVFVQQGQNAVIRYQLFDANGTPLNLGTLGLGAPLSALIVPAVLRLREVIGRGAPMYEVTNVTLNTATGETQATLPDAVAQNPGVYAAEFGVLNADAKLVYMNRFYVWVDRGLFGSGTCPDEGPPQVDEIRLAAADGAPEGNLLLDDYEFDLADFCQATERSVRIWNEVQPPIDLFYTTLAYPYRDNWMRAIIGHLYVMAAKGYTRNQLAYQAAGITVDDQNRGEPYEKLGQLMIAEYREWVKQKKAQLNAEAAITSSGSPYLYQLWY